MATNDETPHPRMLNLASRVRDYELKESELSQLILDILEEFGIKTYGDLITKTEEELLGLPGIGSQIVAEIKEVLGWEGLALGIQLPD
ncbi:MAG: DNA-directed RNA polymerase subunit alpha C-terminal domain-containing protein [Candidatus Saccharimonadales bacterium]